MSNSNGRTLGNLLIGWPKECLAQFCLSLIDPNLNLCENYFSVSDSDAVKAFLHKPIRAKRSEQPRADLGSAPKNTKKYRTALRMLVRNFVWNTDAWKKSGYDAWVDDFKPDIVLFQTGDAAFMCDLARKTAERLHVPLVQFNTEGYYFFDTTWFDPHWTDCFCFPLLRNMYRNSFRKLMQQTSHSVFLNNKLKEDYDKEFGEKSSVLFTGSSCKFEPKVFNNETPKFSYIGNLGINRPLALMEIAEALQAIDKSYHLDVYGKLPRGEESVFDNCSAVRYHGLVSYEEVQNIIRASDVLFHAESKVGQWINNLQYAFSTKIADSLASGSNFFMYAPSYLACSKYIIDNDAAWYAENKEDLVPVLKELLANSEKREQYVVKAKLLAEENHNAAKNVERFKQTILSVAEQS